MIVIPGATERDLLVIREAMTARARTLERAARDLARESRRGGTSTGAVGVRDALADAATLLDLAPALRHEPDLDGTPPVEEGDPGPMQLPEGDPGD